MKRILVSSLAFAFAFGLSVAGAVEPDPSQIYILPGSIQGNGSGCPPGSTVVDLAPDGQAFTVIFSEFLAQIGRGIPLAESRKNCQLNLTVHVPQGGTYAIASVDYRGYMNLARGARGLQKATFYFQGQEPQASAWQMFEGERSADWHIHQEVEVAALVWAPCGVQRSVNINAQVRLEKGTSGGAESIMTMDSEDGSIKQIYHLSWRECDRP